MLRDFEIIELPAEERCTFIGTKSRAPWWCAAIEVCSRLWAGSVLGRRACGSRIPYQAAAGN